MSPLFAIYKCNIRLNLCHYAGIFAASHDNNRFGDNQMTLLFIRTVVTYIFVIIALRITGKRQIGELQPSELVLTLMISNIAAMPLQETGVPLLSSLLPIATLVMLELIISALMLKFRPFRRLISGNSAVVIRNGKILEKNLRKIRLTVDELCEELRLTGNFKIEDIVYCAVETNGQLSVLKKYTADHVTPQDLNLPDKQTQMTYVIISDGIISEHSLAMCGFNQQWLDKILKKENVRPNEILLMTSDCDGQYYLLKKERK